MTDKAIEALNELAALAHDHPSAGGPLTQTYDFERTIRAALEPEHEEKPCEEADGCPTERARLKREWREMRAALEAKAEPDEPSYDETVEYICRGADNIAGVISDGNWTLDGDAAPCSIIRDFLDDLAKMLAGAGARLNENNDGLVFPAPPTTAEVKAQALEEAGRDMVEHFKEQGLDMTMALAVQEGLRQRAEKLREEG